MPINRGLKRVQEQDMLGRRMQLQDVTELVRQQEQRKREDVMPDELPYADDGMDEATVPDRPSATGRIGESSEEMRNRLREEMGQARREEQIRDEVQNELDNEDSNDEIFNVSDDDISGGDIDDVVDPGDEEDDDDSDDPTSFTDEDAEEIFGLDDEPHKPHTGKRRITHRPQLPPMGGLSGMR